VSYNAAIAACGWREAVALLSEHHKPDAASFGACISACEKSGCAEEDHPIFPGQSMHFSV